MADIKIVADYTDLQLMRRELVGVSKDAKASASVFEREYNKVDRQLQKSAKTSQDYYRSLLNIDRESKSAASSASVFEKAILDQERATERLRLKYNDAYRGAQQFKNGLRELNEAHRQNAISADRHALEVEQLKTEYRQFLSGTADFGNRFVQASTQARVGVNRFGVATQQAGYQIGDLLVQIQSGTNFMVAFGQQATQLVGILPMLAPAGGTFLGLSAGALVGISAGLGVAIPLVTALGAAFMRTGQAAEDVDDLEDRVNSLIRTLRDYRREQDALRQGITTDEATFLEQIQQLEASLATAREERDRLAAESSVDYGNAVEGLEAQIQGFTDRLAELREMLRQQQYAETIKEGLEWYNQYLEDFVSGHQEALQITNEQREAERQLAEERRRAADALRLEEQLSYFDAWVAGQQEVVDNLLEQQRLQREQAERQREITLETMRSASAAGQLAAQYGVSLQTASRLVGVLGNLAQNREVILDPRDPRYNRTRATMARLRGEAGTTSPFAETTPTSSGGGGGRELQSLSDYLNSLREEATFRRSLVGISQEQVTQMERERELRDMISQATGVELEIGDSRLQQLVQMEAQTRQLMEAEQQRQALQQSFEQTIERGLMSMVEGASSVEDAFKSMIRNILLEVVRQQFVNPIAKSIGGFFTGLFSANGNAFSGGRVLPFANGGVVSSPTMFPMQGGAGLMGEAGPEAIMPLKRTASGKLGVVSEGGGNITIQQNFNFQANGDESVKRIIAQSAPQIAQMTQQKIMDSRRRGGAMKATFS